MKSKPTRRLGLLLAASSTLFAAGCDSGVSAPTDGSQAGTPAVLQLSPEAVELVVGNQANLSVTAADSRGIRLPGTNLSLTWSSSNPNTVSVDGSGALTAQAEGTAVITAQVGKVKSSATVHAVAPTVKSLKLTPREVRMTSIGDTVRLKADAVWNGKGAPALKWTSVDPAVARVDTDGVVTAAASGTARIVAAAGNLADTARVVVQQVPASIIISPPATTINAIGDTLHLTGAVLDASGRAVPGVALNWVSLSPAVATVNASGMLISRGVGLALITVSAAGYTDTASINVRQVPASISIQPSVLNLAAGQGGKLAAAASDSNGVAIPAASFTWSTSNAGVASVSSAGDVRALAQGSAAVTAEFGGARASVSVNVAVAPVAAIALSPASASLPEGVSVTLRAQLADAAGNELTARPVTWASSDRAVATVSADGQVQAVKAGRATITATAEGKTATASITVVAPTPEVESIASITVTPSTASIPVGASLSLLATPKDASDNALADRAVSWKSQNTAIATVSSAGVVKAVAPGTATITATSEGKSGTSVVTVTAPVVPVASVTLSPATLSLDPGTTRAISAFIKDAAGNLLSGRELAWASSNTAVATVGSDGVVKAVAAGMATITATSEGKSGAVAVTVNAPAAPPPPTGSSGSFVTFPSAEVAAIIGPQLKSGSAANPWPWFDTNARSHADKLWAGDASGALDRSHGYYYDAALVQYTNYYRTGDVIALERARRAADHWYAKSIAELRDYDGYSPREAALAGLMLRAMDGKPEYWPVITSEVQRAYHNWLGLRLSYTQLHFGVRDGGYALLYAAQLAQVHPDAAVRADFRQKALAAARDYYARLQYKDGGWYWEDDSSSAPGGVWEQPFMVGLLLEGMIQVHQMTGDATVRQAILRSVEHLYQRYRVADYVPESKWSHIAWRHVAYLNFIDGTFDSEHRLEGGWNTDTIREGRQRNSLVVHAFGYAYLITGDAKYRTWGDEIFAATYGKGQGPGADQFYGLADFRGKEYNQAYRSAGRYLAWRAK